MDGLNGFGTTPPKDSPSFAISNLSRWATGVNKWQEIANVTLVGGMLWMGLEYSALIVAVQSAVCGYTVAVKVVIARK